MPDLLELAWGIIANAHGGDWSKADPQWRVAAESWRAKYEADLDSSIALQQLRERVARLEGMLTPEQHAQLRLIKQAEHVVDVAKAEGQL